MARAVPTGWEALRNTALPLALGRELDTLALLAEALPADWTVYHRVHWARVEGSRPLAGELDFALVTPHGALLLIEQQTGLLSEPGSLLGSRSRPLAEVAHRLGSAAAALRARLAQGASAIAVDALLYLPDYTVRDAGSVGLDPARIVDAPARDRLADRVLAAGAALPAGDVAALQRFLGDLLQLEPDVGAAAGEVGMLYTRLAGGLSDWARRIEMSPHRLRVVATAGSGKTQLALALFRDALAAGLRPLYVCFNRPLADHMTGLLPGGGEVGSYHQLCNRMLRAAGLNPDFRQRDAFARIEEAFASMAVPEAWRFDVLIVDEGQDFSPAWRDALLRLLREDGRAWWLEDPMQNLYGREPVPLPGWVTLRSDINYRSPRAVVGFLNRVLPGQATVAGSPVEGVPVQVEAFDPAEGPHEQTLRAVTRALGAGFRRDQIAIVSFHGRERSALAQAERLGPIPLRRFTGDYDAAGVPCFTEGDVLVETVYRFKGQSMPCVILTEVDEALSDESSRRKLLVGATRATLALSVVATREVAGQLDAGPA